MLHHFKKAIGHHLINIPGWRTKRKIVVIESDDWGSIRMPSKTVFEKLQQLGYQPENDPYLRYDCLASENDLSNLFEVLHSVKDKNGNAAVITANSVVANPDFKKIRESDFGKYFYEPFTKTIKRYQGCEHSFQLWKEGMAAGVFHPQFHGREHLNVDRWMQGLRNGNKLLHTAFDNEMISISSQPSEMKFNYMEALDFYSLEEQQNKAGIIEDGLRIFKQLFGYSSRSFIANCYIWDKVVEKTLAVNKVKFIQGIPFQMHPHLNGEKHTLKRTYHFCGQKNKHGQFHMVRNAHFEPSQHPSEHTVDTCLKRIDIAFKWYKPAIISSHRLNFIGSIDPANRDKNLKSFSELLHQIKRLWPEVEFMTSDELGKLMNYK